ncbi:MAG: hypothetical protein U0136_15535 [Bdellovibrionota bacterium]
MSYSRDQLNAVYELGRMYFEMGYFVPAERIFAGLTVVDGAVTPARVGLGLLKLERGLFQESTAFFRSAIQANTYALEAKLGLVAAFLGMGELPRARSLLSEVAKEMQGTPGISPEIRTLAEAFAERCQG